MSYKLIRMSTQISQPGETANLFTRVTNKIRSEIATRGLKPGDVVTTEAELGAQLGISRTAVREGVARLRALGLVASGKRRGVIVTRVNPSEIMGLVIPQYAVDQATFAELSELRCSLEVGCVEMAVVRATNEDIERLKKLGKELMTKLIEGSESEEAMSEIDIEFHRTILAATRNPLLKGLHHVITAFFRRAPHELPRWRPKEEPCPWDHAAIAAAFADRDVERARALLSAHFRSYLDIYGTAKHGKVLDGQ